MNPPLKDTPRAFPWEQTMGFLLGVLGWPPQAAWAATPREVALAIAGRMGGAPSQGLDGVGLAVLMQAYPDTPPPADAGEQRDG